MPIYEYRCEPCDRRFEALIRRPDDVVRCPDCGRVEVDRAFSAPAAARVSGGAAPAPALPMSGGGCGRPQCGTGGCAGLGGF